MTRFLIRILEDRKRSKNFTVYSNMNIENIAETIQKALKNGMVPDSRGDSLKSR